MSAKVTITDTGDAGQEISVEGWEGLVHLTVSVDTASEPVMPSMSSEVARALAAALLHAAEEAER